MKLQVLVRYGIDDPDPAGAAFLLVVNQFVDDRVRPQCHVAGLLSGG